MRPEGRNAPPPRVTAREEGIYAPSRRAPAFQGRDTKYEAPV